MLIVLRLSRPLWLFQSTPDLINRENVSFVIQHGLVRMFQSTPDLINRENGVSSTYRWKANLFQSTPDLINRENIAASLNKHNIINVSIHSRFN